MDWWKWLVGAAGAVVLGAFGSALWDALKTGGRMAREWQRQQAERSQAQMRVTAEHLAADTQRLIMWMGMLLLAVLSMSTLSVAVLGLGYIWHGEWAIWLGPTLGTLIATRFAAQGMKTLSLTLDALMLQDCKELEQEVNQLEARKQADPAPSPERAGQSRGP